MALVRIDSFNEPLHEHHRRSKQYSRNEPSEQPISHSATVLNQLEYHGNADTNPQHEFEHEPHPKKQNTPASNISTMTASVILIIYCAILRAHRLWDSIRLR
jgi:hypothetical protein